MNEKFYWDSFDCEIQCDEVYAEAPFQYVYDPVDEFPTGDQAPSTNGKVTALSRL